MRGDYGVGYKKVGGSLVSKALGVIYVLLEWPYSDALRESCTLPLDLSDSLVVFKRMYAGEKYHSAISVFIDLVNWGHIFIFLVFSFAKKCGETA